MRYVYRAAIRSIPRLAGPVRGWIGLAIRWAAASLSRLLDPLCCRAVVQELTVALIHP